MHRGPPDRERRPLLFLDDYDSLHVAAIAAATDHRQRPGHYRLTLAISPDKIEALHLTELGDFLAARIPLAGPGES